MRDSAGVHVRRIKILSAPLFALLTLGACASNIVVYESPTLGRLSNITFVNAAEIQDAGLITFVDGATCTGRRHIQIDDEDAIPAGNSRTIATAADREFALFVRLAPIESDDYGVDIGITGRGPSPVNRRTVTAVGCNANLSFAVEPESHYRVVMSEPTSSRSCSVMVSKINQEGEDVAVESTQRIVRSSRNEIGPFCEPL